MKKILFPIACIAATACVFTPSCNSYEDEEAMFNSLNSSEFVRLKRSSEGGGPISGAMATSRQFDVEVSKDSGTAKITATWTIYRDTAIVAMGATISNGAIYCESETPNTDNKVPAPNGRFNYTQKFVFMCNGKKGTTQEATLIVSNNEGTIDLH